jgi:tetratricopeptide (TPR) repeat protein
MAKNGSRLQSSLSLPDAHGWRRRRTYSFPLADALRGAYLSLRHATHDPNGYWSAYVALVPFRNRTVCAEQRLRLEYALGLAYTGEEALPQAHESLMKALDIAESLGDLTAQAELAYLTGAILHRLTQHAAAYRFYDYALAALNHLDWTGTPADPVFELDLVLRLAGQAWELGWFSTSLRYLDTAYELRATWVPDAAPEAATLAWLDAQLARVRSRPIQAFHQSQAAAALFLDLNQPLNAGRIHTIAAECALDVAEMQGAGSMQRDPGIPGSQRMPRATHLDGRAPDPRTALAQARTLARRGLKLAQAASDPIGASMARLALQRRERLVGHTHPAGYAIAEIEKLARLARRLGDISLLGRAETTLGEALTAAGRHEAGLTAFRRALRLLEEHELGGLAFWPRRALTGAHFQV